MPTGTQKHQHEWSNLQESQSSSAETTPVQLDEAKREGAEPIQLKFNAKELFSVGERGHHIQRERRKTMSKEPSKNSVKTHTNHLDLSYWTTRSQCCI